MARRPLKSSPDLALLELILEVREEMLERAVEVSHRIEDRIRLVTQEQSHPKADDNDPKSAHSSADV